MDVMDIARLNIKKNRELKGLRQQDLADQLHMSLRSYQSLECGETKLDLERLEQIAKILETNIEELLRQDAVFINQEIKDGGRGSASAGDIYNNYESDRVIWEKLIAAKDSENELLREENKYLKEKLDQLLKIK
jgi:transcriptional regulator with XRE-family HTH domain